MDVAATVKATLRASGVTWLSQECIIYSLSGVSEFSKGSPEYFSK